MPFIYKRLPPATTAGKLDKESSNEHRDGRINRMNMVCSTNSDVH